MKALNINSHVWVSVTEECLKAHPSLKGEMKLRKNINGKHMVMCKMQLHVLAALLKGEFGGMFDKNTIFLDDAELRDCTVVNYDDILWKIDCGLSAIRFAAEFAEKQEKEVAEVMYARAKKILAEYTPMLETVGKLAVKLFEYLKATGGSWISLDSACSGLVSRQGDDKRLGISDKCMYMCCLPEDPNTYNGAGRVICIKFDGTVWSGYMDTGHEITCTEQMTDWKEYAEKWAAEHAESVHRNYLHMYDLEYTCAAVEQVPDLISRFIEFVNIQPFDGKPIVAMPKEAVPGIAVKCLRHSNW